LHWWDVGLDHGLIGQSESQALRKLSASWFEIDDFKDAVARAEEMQIETVLPRHRNPPPPGDSAPNHRECWLRDPDGYTVVLTDPDGFWQTQR